MNLRSAMHQDHSAAYHQHHSPLSLTAVKELSPTAGEVRGYDHTALAIGQNTAITVGSIKAIPAAGDSGPGPYSPYCSNSSTTISSSWGCARGLDQKHAAGAGGRLLGIADLSWSYGLASEPKTAGLHSVRSSTDSFPAALHNAIDGAVISQLLPRRVTNGIGDKCVGNGAPGRLDGVRERAERSAHMPAPEGPAAGLGLAAGPAAAKDDLSVTVKQMLAGLPSEQQKLFTQALAASSNPQQLLSAMKAGSTDAAAAFAHPVSTAQITNSVCGSMCASPSSSQPALGVNGVADSSVPNGNALSLQLLIAQQQALAPSGSAWAANPLTPAGQNLMQLLAAEQQAHGHQPRPTESALVQYATLEGSSNSMPPESGRLPQYCQPFSNSAATAPTNSWSVSSLSVPTAVHDTVATAAAILQRQQQQAHMGSMMMQSAAMSTPAAAATSYDQLTAQYLSAQLATAAAAATAATYSAVLGPMCHAPAAGTSRLSTHGPILNSFNRPAHHSCGAVPATSSGTGQTNIPGLRGRRGRSGGPRSSASDSVRQHSSDGSSYSLGLREPGTLDKASAAVAAGVCISALSPATFTEHWGTDEIPGDTASNQDGSNLSVYSPSTSSSSASETALSVCSCRSSIASVGSPGASGRVSSADGEVFLMDLGLHSRDSASSDKYSSLFAAHTLIADAYKCTSMEQTPAILDRATSVSSVSYSKAAVLDLKEQASVTTEAMPAADIQPTISCPVWYPTARESPGDDSWHLELPSTCRLFVGNIGCWVDEALLLSYFGKYGNVVDVQVMWNTKMLARGRRVNREFAFISYSTPLEAARAVHWLDGCRLVDIEKDKNGVTVEYENGERDASPASARNNTATATKPAKG